MSIFLTLVLAGLLLSFWALMKAWHGLCFVHREVGKAVWQVIDEIDARELAKMKLQAKLNAEAMKEPQK